MLQDIKSGGPFSKIIEKVTFFERWMIEHKATYHAPPPEPFPVDADLFKYNYLINGGFYYARRTTPGTLTTVTSNGYGADRWKQSNENADLQYQRNDATGETGLTSLYYGKYRKITNAGKLAIFQILEGINSVPLRGKTVIFQAKLKTSSAKTMRMAILELQSSGVMDTIPTLVSAWNVDGTDPTFGTNLAIVTGAQSKSVTTSWQNFSVSVTIPSTSKNIIVAIWSNADFSASNELNIAEAGLYISSSEISWAPRLLQTELSLCLRYYWKSFEIDVAPAQNAGTNGCLRWSAIRAGAVGNASPSFMLPTPMRTNPTPTTYNTSAANAQVRDGTAAADGSATVAVLQSGDRLYINCSGNAATAVGNILLIHASADAEL